MKCFNCGKEIGESLARKWPVCKDVKCGRERDKQKSAKSHENYKKRIKADNPERRIKINAMKRELPNKDTFAIMYATIGSNKAMARKYRLLESDITQHRIDLFGDMPPKEVQRLGRELLKPHKNKPLKRVPIIVKVFKITDKAKFELGGSGTYEGLEFSRTELANEIALHTKSELLLEV